MNYLMNGRILALLSVLLGLSQIAPLVVAWNHQESVAAFEIPLSIALVLSVVGFVATRGAQAHLQAKDGFFIVSFGWFLATFLGALPYVASGLLDWPGAIFEAAAGFTTTGSSVLTDIESWPQGVLFWRSMTQWLGGMGILLLAIAVLPFLGVGGAQIMKAEVPGPSKDRLTPRLVTTARLLWGYYVILTVLAWGIFYEVGMSSLDAVNHAMTTLATGGFSTRNASFGAFSPAAQWWATLFMVVAGTNFLIYYQLLVKRNLLALNDVEFRVYLALVIGVGVFCGATLMPWDAFSFHALEAVLRNGLFQSASILTTTGFANTDWSTWPWISQIMLISVMLIGGMAGSTAGGLKVVRLIVIGKVIARVVQTLIQPQRVMALHLGKVVLSHTVIEGCVALLAILLGLIILSTLILGGLGMDPVSAFTAGLTCLSNTGPGLGTVGPADNFALVPDLGKLWLALMMITGRLEVFTVLILFSRRMWS
ncbi:MAG: TrkH family potassium uptake protein [Magnetococcales bacterium]|nr:TrkH family potassium uptake protein [Magnetococcales bacterium]